MAPYLRFFLRLSPNLSSLPRIFWLPALKKRNAVTGSRFLRSVFDQLQQKACHCWTKPSRNGATCYVSIYDSSGRPDRVGTCDGGPV